MPCGVNSFIALSEENLQYCKLFHPLITAGWGSLQKEKYPLQAFLSYLNDPATTAQRLQIFLGLGLGPKKPKYCT